MSTLLVAIPSETNRTYGWYRAGRCLGTTTVVASGTALVATTTSTGANARSTKYTDDSLDSAIGVAITDAISSGVLMAASDVSAIALKVMAPGAYFAHHRLVDEVYLAKLDAVEELMPSYIACIKEELHNAHSECPDATLVAVSDSALHTTADPVTQTPSVRAGVDDAGGFHGVPIAAALRRTVALAGTLPSRTIVLHLAEESSVTLLQNGQSLVTSMGLTPVSGGVTQQGSGDLSADAFAAYLLEQQCSVAEGLARLQSEGGLAAVCDECDIESLTLRARNRDDLAQRAITRLTYLLRSHLAAQTAYTNGIDALVLSGPVLYQNDVLRTMLLRDLSILNISVDVTRNAATICQEGNIATNDSVPIYVVKGDETEVMATLVAEVIAASGSECSDSP